MSCLMITNQSFGLTYEYIYCNERRLLIVRYMDFREQVDFYACNFKLISGLSLVIISITEILPHGSG